MGEMADMILDQMVFDCFSEDLDEEFYEVHRQYVAYRIKRGLWIQGDGTPIKLVDMGDRHLNNTIAYLERRQPLCYELWLEAFNKELERRSELKKSPISRWWSRTFDITGK